MRLIYTKDGFTKNEKEEWRVIIFNNILDGLRMTIDAMEEFGIPFEYENTTVRILLFSLDIWWGCGQDNTNISNRRCISLLSCKKRISDHTSRSRSNICELLRICGRILEFNER
jgi:hypothetical protein